MEYSLIFGACGGIGKELSLELASKGYNLILSGQTLSKLNILKEEFLSKTLLNGIFKYLALASASTFPSRS